VSLLLVGLQVLGMSVREWISTALGVLSFSGVARECCDRVRRAGFAESIGARDLY
jgi:hypothetical protein